MATSVRNILDNTPYSVSAHMGFLCYIYSTIQDDCKNLKIKIHRNIILPFAWHGCETWSLILREEPRLRVFENTVMRGIYGPKRDEVTGEWRKLYNEELHDLYSSPNIVRVIKSIRMSCVGHVALMGRREVCTGCWWGNLRERGQWGDPGVGGIIILRWMFRKWVLGVMDWIGLAQDRDSWRAIVNAVKNLRVQ
jgi:hypothetical protein